MAGNATAANLENFIYVSLNAFYQGNISFTSQNLGAGKLDRIPKILHCAQLCVLVLGTFLGLLAALFGPQLLGIYSQSPDVISAGMDRLLIVGITYAICGLMDTTVGSLRGIGYSVLPMLVTLIGACGLRILIVATLFQVPGFHTVQTVYWSYPISWTLTFLAHICCYCWAFRRVRRHLTESPSPSIASPEQ